MFTTTQIFILIMLYIIGIFITFKIIYDYLMIIKNYKEWIMIISLSLLTYVGFLLFIIFLIIKDVKQDHNSK